MLYTIRGKSRDSTYVSLSALYDKKISRVFVTVFSFIFVVLTGLSSIAVIDYSVGNVGTVNGVRNVHAQELDKEVYDESEDPEKLAEEARKAREEALKEERKVFKESFEEYSEGLDDEDDKENILVRLAEKAAREDGSAGITFGTVIRRLLTVGYMNSTPQAIGMGDNKYNCYAADRQRGTPLYHNCDVPNMLTQLLQSIIASFVQFGAINAEEQSAHLTNKAFGLPDNIPGDGAPINPDERAEKYTGLELFGYSFRYTSYKGEWDDIRVQNAARLMTNTGGFERIRMSFKAVAAGIGNATKVAATNATKRLKEGDILGAFAGVFIDVVEGVVAGGISSVLDSSDRNVFKNFGWYRVNYSNTLYKARELSQEEIAAEMQRLLVEFMGSIATEDVEIPEELQSIKEVPLPPEDEISYCNYAEWQSEETTQPPGVNEKECEELYELAKEAARVAADAAVPGSGAAAAAALPAYEWEVDGTRKQEPLTTYRSDYPEVRNGDEPDYFDIAMRFGIKCVPDDTQEAWDTKGPKHSDAQRAGRKEYYNQISSCWEEGWQEAVENKLKVDQNAQTGEAIAKEFKEDEFQKWIQEDPQNRNYNAPWRRYICTDEDGEDLRTPGGNYVFVYDMKGNRNSSCSRIREPIQDGIFGNGYIEYRVPKDTRNLTKENTAFATMFPITDIFSNIGELGLNISVYATRISNTALNLAYGTTLDKIGLDKVIVRVIEEFRDGVFFPLVSLFAAFGVVVIFIRSFRHNNNSNTLKDLLSLTLIAVFGVVILDNPAKLVEKAEEIPATIEHGILSIVFNDAANGGDELCTTGNDSDLTGTNDEGRDALSSNSLRMLMCENWRVGAYNVWAYGQWGTGASNLNATDMHNTNGQLVGYGTVRLGGGKFINNWAAYQMDVLTTGTASFPDAEKNTGAIPRDFYRLVDLQAGPSGGSGTDSTYYRTWAGKEGGQRMATGLLGGMASVILSATVTTYSIAKIQINITMLLLLALMPLMLLLGLTHNQGKSKMKAYFGTLIALIIQRVALAALLAVIFRILFAFGNSTANGAMAMLAMAAISAVFFGLRKQIFAMIGTDVVGGMSGGEQQMAGSNAGEVPGYIASKVQRGVRGIQATTGGIVGGFAAGGISGTEGAVKRSFNSQMAFVRRTQRYRGKGSTQTFFEAYSNAAKEAKGDLDRDPFVGDIKRVGVDESTAMKRYRKDLNAYENFEGEVQKTTLGRTMKVAPNGKIMVEPIHPRLNDATATSRLSNRKAKKVSRSANKTKRSLVEFNNFLDDNNIALDKNGEYMKFSGRDLDSVKERARKAGDDDWSEHIKPGDDVEARPLSSKELKEVDNRYRKTVDASEDSINESKDIYRKQENREYTRDELKNALVEAREKAGKKYSERRFL